MKVTLSYVQCKTMRPQVIVQGFIHVTISLNVSIPVKFFPDTQENRCFALHITQSHLYGL